MNAKIKKNAIFTGVMTLFVRNMVCSRCKMVVRGELEKEGIEFLSVELGEIQLIE